MLKTTGTNNSVATVAKIRPPTTARPSGAFCSPPSPRPSAIGAMPMIMAEADKACLHGCLHGIAEFRETFARESDDEHAVCGRHAHAHDRSSQSGHR